MTKRYLPICIVSILMIGCAKDAEEIKTNSIDLLDGWEISRTLHGLQINVRDIFFIDSEVGFVVGYNGDIYKSVDAGESWQKQNSGTTLHLLSVFFLNEEVGFASGQAMPGCLNDDCGRGSVFLKTRDGGTTWTKTLFDDYVSITSLYFFNESEGLALIYTPQAPNSRDNYIAKTSDGGDNWELIELEVRTVYDEFVCVDNIVFIAGQNENIYKSEDLGVTWETINTPIPARNEVGNIYFYNENIGFLDGITNVYRTADGGLNWDIVDFPFRSFGVFHFYSESEGFNIHAVSAYEGGDFSNIERNCILSNLGLWCKLEQIGVK